MNMSPRNPAIGCPLNRVNIRAPTDIVALNYFFDTMLFGGTILVLSANAMDEKTGNPISKE